MARVPGFPARGELISENREVETWEKAHPASPLLLRLKEPPSPTADGCWTLRLQLFDPPEHAGAVGVARSKFGEFLLENTGFTRLDISIAKFLQSVGHFVIR